MTTYAPITVDDEINEITREIGYRDRLYRRLVAESRMREHDAERRIAVMRQVLKRLRNIKEGGDGQIP